MNKCVQGLQKKLLDLEKDAMDYTKKLNYFKKTYLVYLVLRHKGEIERIAVQNFTHQGFEKLLKILKGFNGHLYSLADEYLDTLFKLRDTDRCIFENFIDDLHAKYSVRNIKNLGKN